MADNNLVIGILAHVDAGKTTLSEGILYLTGATRKLGRVDHKTAFLDTNEIEQNRGITVFSKEARFKLGDNDVVLLDTPGHVDFSAETERTLQVLDYAILLISGADGVQGHTATLWKLLRIYNIPTFVFINKMDMEGTNRKNIMSELSDNLEGEFAEFEDGKPINQEDLATASDVLMKEYFELGKIGEESIAKAVEQCEVFPVCFGAALKMEGVDKFLNTINTLARPKMYGDEFGARVYKITRDKHGVRQTHMKITGGSLKNKMVLEDDDWQEKAEQIRLYSGKNFESVGEVKKGDICTVIGLSHTYAGEALGSEKNVKGKKPIIEPAMNYKMILPDGVDPIVAMQKFKLLEEEDPSLNIIWKEQLKEIHVCVMGRLELEILKHIIRERFDMLVEFGEGSIIYKETIAKSVVGIGHFEPLKHYAEVHLLLQPLPRGSGLVFDSVAREDELDRNWQRLILTHLQEREHPGVMMGTPVTDMKITLIAGKAHLKHTEGGDFRQATYRAIRQGLRKAENILLEPIYSFKITLPNDNVGRLLSDIQRMGGKCELPQFLDENTSTVEGTAPVICLQDYTQEVAAYTKGQGSVSLSLTGYDVCHNQDEVLEKQGYNPESDLANPTGSVFCNSGSAVYVSWDEVDSMAHIANAVEQMTDGQSSQQAKNRACSISYETAGSDELEEIFLRTYGKSKRDEALRREHLSSKHRGETMHREIVLPKLNEDKAIKEKQHIIVDGYNMLFACDETKKIAEANIDSAREALIDMLQNYGAYKGVEMTVVFDGYKMSGNTGTRFEHGNMHIVYTKEAETADLFIENMAYEIGRKSDITVVTSDKAVQMAALGDGAKRLSSREFYGEIISTLGEIREKLDKQGKSTNRPFAKSFTE